MNDIEKEATTTNEKTCLTVAGALKMVLEDNQKTLELLIGKSKGITLNRRRKTESRRSMNPRDGTRET